MLVHEIPAVLHLVIVHHHAKPHMLLTLFQQFVRLSWVSWLANQSQQIRSGCVWRRSHWQPWLTFLQSSPRLFSMHGFDQVVSLCQVEHVATQQSNLLAAMREPVVAEGLHQAPAPVHLVALSTTCTTPRAEVLCETPSLQNTLPT